MARKKKFKRQFAEQETLTKNSKHHIRPTSRGGSNAEANVVLVNAVLHNKYHSLFANRTPEEAITFIVDYFCGGDYEVLHYVLWTKHCKEV